MSLTLYNTLTRKKETFNSIHEGRVGLYTCGPTVYNYAHIGNLRTYVFEDTLKRVLLYNGFRLKHVMNITDLDDKTYQAADAAGMPPSAFADQNIAMFEEKKIELDTLLAQTEKIKAEALIAKAEIAVSEAEEAKANKEKAKYDANKAKSDIKIEKENTKQAKFEAKKAEVGKAQAEANKAEKEKHNGNCIGCWDE